MIKIKSYREKSLKRRMNRTAILQFYRRRIIWGDLTRLSEITGYSVSHLCNVKMGRRSINNTIANAMYYLSRRRVPNNLNFTF